MMLRESFLNFAYLIVAITGIILLSFYSASNAGLQVKINEINDLMIDSIVIVNAKIDSYYLKTNLFLQLNDGTGKIKAIKFNPSIEDMLFIEENTFIQVKGKISKNNETLTLIVQEMKAWK